MQGKDIKEKVPPCREGTNTLPNENIHTKNNLSREKTRFSQNILGVPGETVRGGSVLYPVVAGILTSTDYAGTPGPLLFDYIPDRIKRNRGEIRKGGFIPPFLGVYIKFTTYSKLKKVKKILKSKNQGKNQGINIRLMLKKRLIGLIFKSKSGLRQKKWLKSVKNGVFKGVSHLKASNKKAYMEFGYGYR